MTALCDRCKREASLRWHDGEEICEDCWHDAVDLDI